MKQNRLSAAFSTISRALAHRNYRLFFFGQGLSLVGTWMQQTALGWLTYSLTHSPFLVSLVAFAGQIPAFIASPLSGALADRWNRHRTVLATQSLSMLQAALITILVATHVIAFWQIIVLTAFAGLINSLDMPARQSLVVDMIEDRADLGNAIALNAMIFHGARLIGPAAAGWVIGAVGEWPCFLANTISFLAVLAALLAMRIRTATRDAAPSHLLHGVGEGMAYAMRSTPIRTILALVAMIGMIGTPLGVLMPFYASKVLGGDAKTFGLLLSVSGLGALGGCLLLASRKSVLGLGRLMAMMTALLGAATIGVACTRVLGVALVLVTLIGFAVMITLAASNTILQTIVDEDKRGRTTSLYMMAFMGTAPVGSLLAGGLAGAFGTPVALAVSGVLCLIGALVFALRLPALRASVHPIYAREGIIPELSSAMESVTELSVPPEDCA